MKKNILLFGANGFIGKKFLKNYSDEYNIYPVYRNRSEEHLSFNFENCETIQNLVEKLDFQIDGILFLQGKNPSIGINEISENDFINMMRINIVSPLLFIRDLKEKLASNCSVIFISSVAKQKGSYDPSYAVAKAGLVGLIHSLANHFPNLRFNSISLGLVEDSPVYQQMTEDFRKKHASRMQSLVKAENVVTVLDMIIQNTSINRADIAVDGGFI